jgi:hypothetical protein
MSVDLIGHDLSHDSRVIVENQLEQSERFTDHAVAIAHRVQLLNEGTSCLVNSQMGLPPTS